MAHRHLAVPSSGSFRAWSALCGMGYSGKGIIHLTTNPESVSCGLCLDRILRSRKLNPKAFPLPAKRLTWTDYSPEHPNANHARPYDSSNHGGEGV